jgi:hypothetical protein
LPKQLFFRNELISFSFCEKPHTAGSGEVPPGNLLKVHKKCCLRAEGRIEAGENDLLAPPYPCCASGDTAPHEGCNQAAQWKAERQATARIFRAGVYINIASIYRSLKRNCVFATLDMLEI